MVVKPKTVMIFGAGEVGGAVADVLALTHPEHRYVVLARDEDYLRKRVNLTRYICTQWGRYPSVLAEPAELTDTSRTAEVLAKYSPDLVFNAATPFPWWWLINQMPERDREVVSTAGPGMWCALNCVLPMMLSDAILLSGTRPLYVNACYPDMVNRFLWGSEASPLVGIGNLSNLIPGFSLLFAHLLARPQEELVIRLVCHHFTSLNGPTIGGSGGAPYHLSIESQASELTFGPVDNEPFQQLKDTYPRVRGRDGGQAVTISSAATLLGALLEEKASRHHAPGPLGLAGGYPVSISSDWRVTLDLPRSLDEEAAAQIMQRAQVYDGIEQVEPGIVRATDRAKAAFREVVGLDLPDVTRENALEVARAAVIHLNSSFSFGLSL